MLSRSEKRPFSHICQGGKKVVGPLVDNAGNIITQGFLMAEELNMHFSSVFTREDTVRYLYQKQSSRDQREFAFYQY